MWNKSRTAEYSREMFICLVAGMLSVLALNSLIRVFSSPAHAVEQHVVQHAEQVAEQQTEQATKQPPVQSPNLQTEPQA